MKNKIGGETVVKRKEVLDVSACAFDNCYGEIYGVVQVPFDIHPYEEVRKKEEDSRPNDYNWKERYYVNTPLCKEHYGRVPAMAYIWCVEDEIK